MAVTDLTGTTWKVNSNVYFLTSGLYYLNFFCDNTLYKGIKFTKLNEIPVCYLLTQTIGDGSGDVIYEGPTAIHNIVVIDGISATNATLISWFENYATLQPTVARKSVDLQTLTGWSSLADGSHSISIVAKADGYSDSEKSKPTNAIKGAAFVQIFPTTAGNYTAFKNLNKSKVYSILTNAGYGALYHMIYSDITNQWAADNGMNIVHQTDDYVEAKVISGNDVNFVDFYEGTTLEGDREASIENGDFDGFSTTKVYSGWICFVEDTKITLSDGSTKLVQDIQYGDEVLCYNFYAGEQTTSYVDWMIPERIATTYWEITLSDGTVLNLVGPIGINGKSHRLYNITKQRFDYPQDFETNDLTLKEDGTTAYVVSCRQIEKTVKFYNIASHEHINVYANGVLTSNRLNNRFKIVDNKFTDEKVMTDKEVADYCAYLESIKA